MRFRTVSIGISGVLAALLCAGQHSLGQKPGTVPHADLDVPGALMNAIKKSEQSEAILEYLGNRAVPRETRERYLEIVRQTLQPDRRPRPDSPRMAATLKPRVSPVRHAMEIPPRVLQAIMKSDQRAAILDYLNNTHVPLGMRQQYLETVRQTLLPDEKK